jgi:hypothetical protein
VLWVKNMCKGYTRVTLIYRLYVCVKKWILPLSSVGPYIGEGNHRDHGRSVDMIWVWLVVHVESEST